MTRSTTWAALALAAGLTLTGCTSDDAAPEEETSQQSEQVEESAAPSAEFPAEIVPDYPESTEVSRTAEPSDDLIGFQLVSTTADEVDAVLDFYRSHLEGIDFTELTTAEDGDDRTVNYQRQEGTEVVSVTVGPDPADDQLRRIIVSGTVADATAEEEPPADDESADEGDEDQPADEGSGGDQG